VIVNYQKSRAVGQVRDSTDNENHWGHYVPGAGWTSGRSLVAEPVRKITAVNPGTIMVGSRHDEDRVDIATFSLANPGAVWDHRLALGEDIIEYATAVNAGGFSIVAFSTFGGSVYVSRLEE
jgi:hypothetical protein